MTGATSQSSPAAARPRPRPRKGVPGIEDDDDDEDDSSRACRRPSPGFTEALLTGAPALAGRVEKPSVATVFHEGPPDAALEAFYAVAVPEITPGPAWLREIAMVDYDYQAPVAISNGWGDNLGFGELSPEQRQRVLELFHWRKQHPTRLRWLEAPPAWKPAQ